MASINLTLPDDKLQFIERELEATGETRSEFFERLLDAFAKQQKEAGDAERYRRGYEKYPETDEEFAYLEAAQSEVLTAYPWEGEDL